MKRPLFCGSAAAVTTPFFADGAVDFETLGRCYYESRTDDSSGELLATMCADLETQLAKLKELKIQLSQTKNQE